MAPFKRGRIWWYTFTFFGRTIRESSKSTSKTIALKAEQQHRRRLEEGFLNIRNVRQQRVRYLKDIIAEYLEGYRLRNRSVKFAEYALGHVSRLLGEKWIIDIDETVVLRYQEDLTPEEIADTLDAPLATVKSHLQRGLKLLRAKATCRLREYIRGV